MCSVYVVYVCCMCSFYVYVCVHAHLNIHIYIDIICMGVTATLYSQTYMSVPSHMRPFLVLVVRLLAVGTKLYILNRIP